MKKAIYLLGISLLMISLMNVGYPQNLVKTKIDSLRQAYANARHDTIKVNILLSMAVQYRRTNRDTVIILAQEAQAIAQRANYALGIAKSYLTMAGSYHLIGNATLAVHCYEKAISILEHTTHYLQLATANNNLGLAYWSQGNNSRALIHYLKAMELYERVKTSPIVNVSANLDNIAGVYSTQGNYSKAIQYRLKAINIMEKADKLDQCAIILYNLSMDYFDEKKYKQALDFLHKCLYIYQKNNLTHGLGSVYTGLSDVYYALKDSTQGDDYLRKSLLLKQKKSSPEEINQNISLAQSLINNKEYDKALVYAREGYNQATMLNFVFLRNSLLNKLATIYEQLGDYPEALKHFKEYKVLDDSLFNLQKIREINKITLERVELEQAQLKQGYQLQQALLQTNELIRQQQAQKLIIAAKEAEAEHLFYMAREEKDKRKADSLYAIAKKTSLEAQNLRIIDQKLAAENKSKNLLLEHAKQEKLFQQRIDYLILVGFLASLLFAILVFRAKQKVHKAKQEIYHLNQNLESLVAQRTEALAELNNQLAEYAFMNAHKVRGPLARILGLIQVFEMIGLQNEAETSMMLDKIGIAANELDVVIKTINAQLEEADTAPIDTDKEERMAFKYVIHE